MAKYQKYAEYQDSGVEWLGDVPKHWLITTFKRVIKEHSGNGFPIELQGDESGVIPFLKVSDINGANKYSDRCNNRISKEALNKYGWNLVPKGSIVTGKIGEALRKNHRKILSEDSVIDNNCIGIEPIHLTENYNFYVHKVIDFDWYVNGGAIPSISVQKYKAEIIAIPNENEQTQIANFLDHETAKIDKLIAKQEKLIELLKEKRQAVISHAVTKGLNPNVPMKDSGVEWLGEVPEHWDVCKIQYYAKIESGHTPSKTNERYWENCTIPWVSLNDSKQLRVVDYISDTKYKISELGLANSSARILPKDTVVFTRDASIGLSAITTKEMAVSQHLIAWLPKKERLSPEFLLLIFYAMEKEFNRYTFGSTIKTIGMDDVSSLMAAFPSLAEQIDIVERCFSQFLLIDKSIGKSLALLDVLKEKRTALISAAVTGKIDVRNWQHPNQKNNKHTELSA
ncbi:restriction endonuclease subunit S [Acinetobacter bereziniae]|uniref:restriction endonuclease subunit S n=1 Tax=Acinetobacter bereziniae TaxID=106648 RepID=UPI00300A3D0C